MVKNDSNMTNFEAIQRLNAGDLVFAYLVGLIEGDGWFSVAKNGKYVKYELELKWVLEMFNYYIKSKRF